MVQESAKLKEEEGRPLISDIETTEEGEMALDIWVDYTYGSDANPGTLESPKKTLQASMTALDPGGTMHLMPGDHIVTGSPAILETRAGVFQIVGEGAARVRNIGGNAFFSHDFISSVGNRTLFVKNVIFHNFERFYTCRVLSAFASYIYDLRLENVVCVQDSAVVGSDFVEATGSDFDTGALDVRVVMQNCTVRNYENIFQMQPTVAATFQGQVVNCFLDGFTSLLGGSPGFGSGFFNKDYNAYDGNTGEVHGLNTTGVLRTDIYSNVSDTPVPDLSLLRGGSPSPLIGIGEYGDDIGAPYWPVFQRRSQAQSGIAWFPTDWSNWQNDERYWDTTGNVPGPDGPVNDASPVILSGTITNSLEPKAWQPNTFFGGRNTARSISEVFDAGSLAFSPTLKGISWWAEEDEFPASGLRDVADNTDSAVRQVEYRASNKLFEVDATTTEDIEWTLIKKTDSVNVVRRYWQFRVVLRRDGV